MAAEGVKWVTNNTSPALTRYHGAAGANTLYSPATQAVATTYFNALSPWGLMRRCNLWTDGTPTAYYGDRCYTDTDVTNMGQAMAQIPQFCYAIDVLTANQVWYWVGQVGDKFRLSDNSGDYTFSAPDIHPVFSVGGVAKSYAYIGAYEASLNLSNVMQSVAGVAPTNQAIIASVATARGYANLLGSRWGLSTVQAWAATVLLFIIEYATFYTHGIYFGYGNASANALITGTTTSYGNVTGAIANNSSAVGMTYRGIENFWGNEGQFLEGLNIKANYAVWVAAQATTSGYYDCTAFDGVKYIDTTKSWPSDAATFITSLATGTYRWAFIPATLGGAQNQYACGYAAPATANRVIFTTGGFAQNWALQNPLTQFLATTTSATASYGYRLQYHQL